ncbi:hypothetical protein [Deinococcus xianganensis]|uniref:Uncharacterized protein n=1 Tax=Deinococcus xianganensis TaxID=1507289 RepID=A0A6I4YFM1_9DEIO|nr:hypothetical protein [Deinococcus xianganensis]MXV18614.1 hypothetical protein [Deinococcus xianganensis]
MTLIDSAAPIPPGPPPVMPEAPPPPLPDEVLNGPAPTLNDVALPGSSQAAAQEDEPDAPPMTPEQIIGVVAELSAFGLPPELATRYKAEYKSNPLVQLGVQFSGLTDALAAYGMTAGGGKMPEWLSVALGVAVLGYGVYATRSKYAPQPFDDPAAAAPGADGGFAGAGISTPLQATNLGFSGSGAGGTGD